MEAQAKSAGVSMPECLGFLVTNLGCTENQAFQHQAWIQGQLRPPMQRADADAQMDGDGA